VLVISVHSAPRAAVGAVGTGVLAGAMRCGALAVAQAAPAIASPPNPVAADLASAAPTCACIDTNASPQAAMARAGRGTYLGGDDHHWWDPQDGWAHRFDHDH